ncbi:MAG: acetoacetate--CoA ligase [Gammaproteobacteria bacterium]|nr:acetoacetate--CoA ligase [Gammaproteobacteria bacterium]
MPTPAPAADVLWRPAPGRIADAHLTRFAAEVGARTGLDLGDYAALHAWSLREPGTFWREVARYADLRWEPGTVTIERPGQLPGAAFFPDARLNFAANLLVRDDDGEALVFRGEDGSRRVLTWRELGAEVARIADGLRACGVGRGDRVAALLPNVPEAIIAMLAAASIGAVFTACSPDFGAAGAIDRFGQVGPRVLFATDGYRYAGRAIDTRATIAAIAAALPEIERIVVVPFPGLPHAAGDDRREVDWERFGSPDQTLVFEPLPFNTPLWILYSSGTTGKPKCIVHGAGGTLLQHRKEHLLHVDLRAGERFFYFTTCGWMMWNWLATGLATGATLVLFDGAPMHPDPLALWRIAAEERVGVFGASARYLAAVEKSGCRPRREVDLAALRTVLSTGSPLLPEQYDYVYREVGADLHLASISGGTDIVSCFVLGCPTLPVHRGEIQVAGLGMDVRVVDEHGAAITSERGELICAAPFPTVPLGFWNDPDGSRLRAAYFERFPGLWHHGDFAERTATGFRIHGRSDAVLNPGGVRIGTAEIYRQVERLGEVLESLAVGQDWQGDVRVILFVRLREGVALTDALTRRIRDAIRTGASPRHVPAHVIAVADLPRTRSGKLAELAVRDVIHGRSVGNVEALANPEVLALFRDLPALRVAP